MLYTGVDLIEVDRIEHAVARWGERFLQRVFTPAELAACQMRAPSLAARWAAKEATAKALGGGLRGLGGAARATTHAGIAWTDVEVTSDALGRPALLLHARAAERARALQIVELSVSLSHTHTLAIAFVVAQTAETSPPA